MKRVWLLALTVIVSLTMMAGNVTPEKALQQATSFVQSRIQKGEGPRMTPGTPLHLNLASRVSGLYVFNVSNNGGFVIVSPDDCVQTILGYSDCGQFDPDNIPCNMRAWLQGYADEIAWAQQQTAEGRLQTTGNRAKAPQKTGRTDVAPMCQTHWAQGEPFNNKCVFGGVKCVTGCVATAMAQVLYYHQWPTETADVIPAYTTNSNNYSVDAIPAGSVINWSNIQQEYGLYKDENLVVHNEPYNDVQADAVAELLLYCGASVSMDYGTGSSGAMSTEIPFALIHYLGYKNTAQLLNRDSYSSNDWDEIIYHEMISGRPVLYSGVTIGNEGHEFVCDGYDADEGTYHINWGWQGVSNGYFVLSALDPDEQGIGGSSSNQGFNREQDAVIGIQKPDATGDVSERVGMATGISLQLIDLSFSENPTINGNDVYLYVTIKNNSINDFDNGLSVWESTQTQNIPVYGYTIPSGATQAIGFPITPGGTYRYEVGYVGSDNYLHSLAKTHELIVWPANVTKTMNNYGWATYSSVYPLDFSGTGLEAYIVTGSNGNAILKEPVTKVPANTGLVISGTAGAEFTIPLTLDTPDDVSENKMVAVSEQITLEKATDGNENFVLSVQSGKVVFARINNDAATVRAGQAYLVLPTDVAAPWLAIDGDDEETTSLREMRNEETGMGNAQYYTLDGRRVSEPTKGIYIMNGKKVVIK